MSFRSVRLSGRRRSIRSPGLKATSTKLIICNLPVVRVIRPLFPRQTTPSPFFPVSAVRRLLPVPCPSGFTRGKLLNFFFSVNVECSFFPLFRAYNRTFRSCIRAVYRTFTEMVFSSNNFTKRGSSPDTAVRASHGGFRSSMTRLPPSPAVYSTAER